MMIIRRELENALRNYKWLLLYGRRKTGKTFYVRERGEYDRYFIVTKSRTLIDIAGGEEFSQKEIQKILPVLLESERIVIDEFHRLSEPVLSMLQGLGGKGRIILVTSTMHFFRKVIRSPLLGLFELREVGLVDPRDAIQYAASLGLRERGLLEVACIVREPWLAPKIEKYGVQAPYHIKEELRIYVPHLVGEVFDEEDTTFTARYAGVLGALASGRVYSSEISSYLFSRGLIEKDNPGLVSQYLQNMIRMGLIKAVVVEGRKRKSYAYRHVSPVTDFAFYLNEKYGFFEADLDENTVGELFRERIPLYIEWFFEELLAKLFKLQPIKIVKPELEVDIALREHKKIRVVAEVKWRRNIESGEVRLVEKRLSKFKAKRILIVPSKDVLSRFPQENIEVWDWRDIVEVTTRENVGLKKSFS